MLLHVRKNRALNLSYYFPGTRANSFHVNGSCFTVPRAKRCVCSSRLPFLGGLHVEGALDDSGPLQAADDECVGFGPFRLHQLAF